MPKIKSRIIPPPIAVVIPSTHAPKISISFFIAVSAPDIENAITPIVSKIKKTRFMNVVKFLSLLISNKVTFQVPPK